MAHPGVPGIERKSREDSTEAELERRGSETPLTEWHRKPEPVMHDRCIVTAL